AVEEGSEFNSVMESLPPGGVSASIIDFSDPLFSLDVTFRHCVHLVFVYVNTARDVSCTKQGSCALSAVFPYDKMQHDKHIDSLTDTADQWRDEKKCLPNRNESY
ncbi:Replicase polyprotein 1ab, partial [Dissostichus eleginoides]